MKPNSRTLLARVTFFLSFNSQSSFLLLSSFCFGFKLHQIIVVILCVLYLYMCHHYSSCDSAILCEFLAWPFSCICARTMIPWAKNILFWQKGKQVVPHETRIRLSILSLTHRWKVCDYNNFSYCVAYFSFAQMVTAAQHMLSRVVITPLLVEMLKHWVTYVCALKTLCTHATNAVIFIYDTYIENINSKCTQMKTFGSIVSALCQQFFFQQSFLPLFRTCESWNNRVTCSYA